MIVQSGGGKLYAVIADTPQYELGLLPILTNVKGTAVVTIRCRYKDRINDWIDATIVPKPVLLAGVERSKNTLRGIVHLTTGMLMHKLGKNSHVKFAEQVVQAAEGFLWDDTCPLKTEHMREDFIADFAKLLEPQVMNAIPGLISEDVALMSAMDLAMMQEGHVPTPGVGEAVKAATAEKGDTNVVKVPFGGDHEPKPASGALKQGVDEPAPDEAGSENEPA